MPCPSTAGNCCLKKRVGTERGQTVIFKRVAGGQPSNILQAQGGGRGGGCWNPALEELGTTPPIPVWTVTCPSTAGGCCLNPMRALLHLLLLPRAAAASAAAGAGPPAAAAVLQQLTSRTMSSGNHQTMCHLCLCRFLFSLQWDPLAPPPHTHTHPIPSTPARPATSKQMMNERRILTLLHAYIRRIEIVCNTELLCWAAVSTVTNRHHTLCCCCHMMDGLVGTDETSLLQA